MERTRAASAGSNRAGPVTRTCLTSFGGSKVATITATCCTCCTATRNGLGRVPDAGVWDQKHPWNSSNHMIVNAGRPRGVTVATLAARLAQKAWDVETVRHGHESRRHQIAENGEIRAVANRALVW